MIGRTNDSWSTEFNTGRSDKIINNKVMTSGLVLPYGVEEMVRDSKGADYKRVQVSPAFQNISDLELESCERCV